VKNPLPVSLFKSILHEPAVPFATMHFRLTSVLLIFLYEKFAAQSWNSKAEVLELYKYVSGKFQ
jgi:hypothetical protein